jgi:CRP-like cAMP-binding protein
MFDLSCLVLTLVKLKIDLTQQIFYPHIFKLKGTVNMASRQILNHLGQCTLMKTHFNALSENQLERIDNNRTELIYKKGENLCKQGAFISNVIFIQSGLVKLYVENNDSTAIIFLKNRDSFIGLSSLFGNGVHHYSAEALSDTKVCNISFSVVKEVLEENSSFGTDVIKIINKDMILAFDRIASFSNKQLHGRFAELLLDLQQDIYKSNPFKLTLSKTDLAKILSTSKESVSRLFSSLKKDEIIKENNHSIHILKLDRLKRISEAG